MVLTARRLFAIAAITAVAIAVLAAFLAWRSWESGAGPVLGEEPITGSAFVEPEQHLFADAVGAQLELVIDRARVDPESVEVGANFAPYRALRPVRVTRTDEGPITRLRYEYLLGCLTASCLPRGAGRVEFGAAAVEYTRRGLAEPSASTIEWPPLRSAGRIPPAQLEQAALRAEIRDLPPPSYRVSPRAVETVALVLTVLFAAGAAILLLRLVPFERLAARLGARRADRRSALERALAHVRESTADGRSEERRRALERLAAELRQTSNPELAHDATRLAWSERVPAEAGVAPLSDRVEQVISEDGA